MSKMNNESVTTHKQRELESTISAFFEQPDIKRIISEAIERETPKKKEAADKIITEKIPELVDEFEAHSVSKEFRKGFDELYKALENIGVPREAWQFMIESRMLTYRLKKHKGNQKIIAEIGKRLILLQSEIEADIAARKSE